MPTTANNNRLLIGAPEEQGLPPPDELPPPYEQSAQMPVLSFKGKAFLGLALVCLVLGVGTTMAMKGDDTTLGRLLQGNDWEMGRVVQTVSFFLELAFFYAFCAEAFSSHRGAFEGRRDSNPPPPYPG